MTKEDKIKYFDEEGNEYDRIKDIPLEKGIVVQETRLVTKDELKKVNNQQ